MANELLIAFGIMGVCLVVHITGMILVTQALVRQRQRIEDRFGFVYAPTMLIAVFSVVIVLHVTEAMIWAGFYSWSGLFKDFETSLYFSMQSYSTVGYGDVLLPQKWRLLGTIESISGVLMCGLSAAFLFAIVNALFRARIKGFRPEQPHQSDS